MRAPILAMAASMAVWLAAAADNPGIPRVEAKAAAAAQAGSVTPRVEPASTVKKDGDSTPGA